MIHNGYTYSYNDEEDDDFRLGLAILKARPQTTRPPTTTGEWSRPDWVRSETAPPLFSLPKRPARTGAPCQGLHPMAALAIVATGFAMQDLFQSPPQMVAGVVAGLTILGYRKAKP